MSVRWFNHGPAVVAARKRLDFMVVAHVCLTWTAHGRDRLLMLLLLLLLCNRFLEVPVISHPNILSPTGRHLADTSKTIHPSLIHISHFSHAAQVVRHGHVRPIERDTGVEIGVHVGLESRLLRHVIRGRCMEGRTVCFIKSLLGKRSSIKLEGNGRCCLRDPVGSHDVGSWRIGCGVMVGLLFHREWQRTG